MQEVDVTDFPPKKTSSEEFDISTDASGNVILNRYNGKGGDVVIPDGVTHIGKGAFDGILNTPSKPITSVYIPDSVVSNDDYAFLCCYRYDGGLSEVRMSSNIVSIGKQAFREIAFLVVFSQAQYFYIARILWESSLCFF